jgi:alcohol dehydrogenase class IV
MQAVIVDPMLALSVPMVPTVQGALTALGQCMESYLLGCTDPATEALALQGIEVVAAALATPLVEGKMNLKNVAMREKLALASVLSGFAANSSGCGGAHAIAVAMGGISDIPHSQITSAFLPFVFDRYAQIAEDNAGDEFFDELKDKLERIADRLTAASGFQGASVSAWLRYVSTRFDLPTLVGLELDEAMLRGVVERAALRQDATMDHRTDESVAILEKDDLRAVLDAATAAAPSSPKIDQDASTLS